MLPTLVSILTAVNAHSSDTSRSIKAYITTLYGESYLASALEYSVKVFICFIHKYKFLRCKSRRKRAVKSVCDGNSMPPVAQSAASDSGRATGGAPHNENKLCTPSEKEQIKQARERQKAKRELFI